MGTAKIIDTETTGVEEGDQVIEYAEIMLDLDLGAVAELIQRYRPTAPMKLGALATHHITPQELMNEPEVPESFQDKFEGVEYIIGHNVDFDWRMLGKPKGVKRICTLALARLLHPDLDSHTLGAMLYHTQDGLEAKALLRNAHSALHDCKFVLLLLNHWEKHFASWEELYKLSQLARLPKVMTFGKHKGKPVEKVDHGYRQWYFNQPDPDPWLLRAWGYRVDIE